MALAPGQFLRHDVGVKDRRADNWPQADKPPIAFEQLNGIKQLRHVAGLLSKLHTVGCDRDKAANGELHFDDYVMLILLYLFNPMIESIALLQGVVDQLAKGLLPIDLLLDAQQADREEAHQVDGVADEPVSAGHRHRRRCAERTQQTRQPRDQAAGQRRALEKTGVLIPGRLFKSIRPR